MGSADESYGGFTHLGTTDASGALHSIIQGIGGTSSGFRARAVNIELADYGWFPAQIISVADGGASEILLLLQLSRTALSLSPRQQARRAVLAQTERVGRIPVAVRYPLQHDRQGKAFFLGGVFVPFTDQEYKLTAYFVEHPGVILSVEELFKGAWRRHSANDTIAMRTCICRVRKKLGQAEDLIRTCHGGGYIYIP
jgi:hypothetical protein